MADEAAAAVAAVDVTDKAPPKKKAAEAPPAAPALAVLILSAGMTGADLAAALEQLKEKSKSISVHKKREIFWQAYTKLISKTSSFEGGPVFCFLLYRVNADGDGEVEAVELTKRQKGLVHGGCEILGHKIKPIDPDAKGWMMAYSEEDAQAAWHDLMEAEPCIYLAPDGVYVGTKQKRALCKGLSGMPKSVKDVEALVGELAPDKPLKSISFVANAPPAVNSYNTFLAGPTKLDKELPPTIGQVKSTSPDEIYSYFLSRKNGALLQEAAQLLGTMQADAGKKLVAQIYAGSQKECVVAYKNALMKKVYVHESMKKFIDRVQKDGQVEMHVIRGDVADSDFGKFGSLVFELYYRVDLDTMS